MARFISFGDSFTWGSDMKDTLTADEWRAQPKAWRDLSENQFINTYSRNTWNAKLARTLGLDYICYAEQGCSNQSIVRQFFKYAPSFRSDDLINVNFTWRDRYDFYDVLTNNWVTVRPTGTEENRFHELYYKHIHGTVWDQVESLKSINLILCYLKFHRISYCITCIDDLIYTDPFHVDALITTLREESAKEIRWFDGLGLYEWSKQNNFPVSEMWHPLEEAHDAAFEHIMNKWMVME